MEIFIPNSSIDDIYVFNSWKKKFNNPHFFETWIKCDFAMKAFKMFRSILKVFVTTPGYGLLLQYLNAIIYSTISFITFETFCWLTKFFFHHKWNEAWLSITSWYIPAVSRVTKQFKELGSYETNKYQESLETLWSYCLMLNRPLEVKTLLVLAKIVRYFTRNLDFVSNVLWMIVASVGILWNLWSPYILGRNNFCLSVLDLTSDNGFHYF